MRKDGVSPAANFLAQLAKGIWVEDPDMSELPDDAQIHDYDKLLAWCQLLADNGVPEYRDAVKHLRDGIWEFRIGAKRLSFFDTPGDGTYNPKLKITDRDLATHDDEFWWFPEFDEKIRLGHAFPKMSQKTRKEDIDQSLLVRKEDLSHDREA